MNASTNPASDAVAAFNQRLFDEVVKPLARDGMPPSATELIQSFAAGLVNDSQRWLDVQNRYYRRQLELWSSFAARAADEPPPTTPASCTRRGARPAGKPGILDAWR